MRKFILAGLVAAMVVAVAAMAAEIPEKVTIKDCAATKGAVEFPHKAHIDAKISCDKCHHTQKGLTAEAAKTTAVDKCSKCHVTPEKATTPKCADKTMTANPFHMSCVACHKETKAAKADTKAPTMCTGCHAKTGA